MSEAHTQVIIIGAGIAGLTAAWELNKAGIKTLVLEADNVVGGRMQSIQSNGVIIDYGAQFLSNAYTIIPTLVKETKLSVEFVETSEWLGLIRKNGIALVHPRKPWYLVSHHIISFWDLLKLAFNQFRLFNFNRKSFPLNDITAWIEYDDQLADEWVVKNFGETTARELTASIFNGFYFQSLDDSSAAMAAAVISFSSHQSKTMALLSGMRSLPQKLANSLNVKTSVSVTRIAESSSKVTVMTESGEFTAEHVICTVPAPIAKNIFSHSDQQTTKLFGTPYSSSITISLLADKNWLIPTTIKSVYGMLVNPTLDSKIAAVTIENNKCQTRSKQGYLVNIMLADKWAKKLLGLTDEAIYTEVQTDIEKILPDIDTNLRMKKIFRWEYAMPCTPVGRAQLVKEYRETRNISNRIWLAGDYLGLPWTDSAAQTGLWAAKQVIERLKGNNNG